MAGGRHRSARRRTAETLPAAAGALGIAVVGRPPAASTGEVALVQTLLSLAINLADAASRSLLVVPSSDDAVTRLQPLIAERLPALRPKLISLTNALRAVSPTSTADLDQIPEMFRQRMQAARPATWGPKQLHVRDLGRYTSLYRSIHQAVAVRYAHRVLGVETVLLLRPEAYLWRRVGLADLLRTRHEIFYAECAHATPQPLASGVHFLPSYSSHPCASSRSAQPPRPHPAQARKPAAAGHSIEGTRLLFNTRLVWRHWSARRGGRGGRWRRWRRGSDVEEPCVALRCGA